MIYVVEDWGSHRKIMREGNDGNRGAGGADEAAKVEMRVNEVLNKLKIEKNETHHNPLVL